MGYLHRYRWRSWLKATRGRHAPKTGLTVEAMCAAMMMQLLHRMNTVECVHTSGIDLLLNNLLLNEVLPLAGHQILLFLLPSLEVILLLRR